MATPSFLWATSASVSVGADEPEPASPRLTCGADSCCASEVMLHLPADEGSADLPEEMERQGQVQISEAGIPRWGVEDEAECGAGFAA